MCMFFDLGRLLSGGYAGLDALIICFAGVVVVGGKCLSVLLLYFVCKLGTGASGWGLWFMLLCGLRGFFLMWNWVGILGVGWWLPCCLCCNMILCVG